MDTAWKVPPYRVFLVRIFPYLDWMQIFIFSLNTGECRPEKHPYLDNFRQWELSAHFYQVFCLFINELGTFWQTVTAAYVFCWRKLDDCHTCFMKMFNCSWWGSVKVLVIFSNYCQYWLTQWARQKKPQWVRYFWSVHHNFFVNSRIQSYDKQIPRLTHYRRMLLFYTPWKHGL